MCQLNALSILLVGLFSRIGRHSTAKRGGESVINRMLECSAGARDIMQQSKIPRGDIDVFRDLFFHVLWAFRRRGWQPDVSTLQAFPTPI